MDCHYLHAYYVVLHEFVVVALVAARQSSQADRFGDLHQEKRRLAFGNLGLESYSALPQSRSVFGWSADGGVRREHLHEALQQSPLLMLSLDEK